MDDQENSEVQESLPPTPGRGTVKWFNLDKGYGFIIPEDGSKDVFLHISILKEGGHTTLEKGATVTYSTGLGRAGPEVVQVLEIDTSTAIPRPSKMERNYDNLEARLKDSHLIEGTVKWFNPNKGYGFVTPCDGSRDVFIHIAVVRHFGLQTLVPEQKLQIHVTDGPMV